MQRFRKQKGKKVKTIFYQYIDIYIVVHEYGKQKSYCSFALKLQHLMGNDFFLKGEIIRMRHINKQRSSPLSQFIDLMKFIERYKKNHSNRVSLTNLTVIDQIERKEMSRVIHNLNKNKTFLPMCIRRKQTGKKSSISHDYYVSQISLLFGWIDFQQINNKTLIHKNNSGMRSNHEFDISFEMERTLTWKGNPKTKKKRSFWRSREIGSIRNCRWMTWMVGRANPQNQHRSKYIYPKRVPSAIDFPTEKLFAQDR